MDSRIAHLLFRLMAFIFFFFLMPRYFTAKRAERVASRVGSIAGVLAGVSCIGIAATPWDVHLAAHMIFVYALSASFLLSVVFYLVAILANKRYPRAYALVFAVYAIVLGVYVGLMLLGPDMDTKAGLRVLATGQKVVIYLGMICWSLQFLGAYKYHNRHIQWHQHRQVV